MKTRKPIFLARTNYLHLESLASYFIQLFHHKCWILLLPFLLSPLEGNASPIDRHNIDSSKPSQELWPLVGQHLESDNLDSSLHIIFLLTRGHCQQDFNCQTAIYSKLMFELERKFNLPAAIRVAREIVKIARFDQNTPSLADAHLNLHRFHDALGHERESILNMEMALELFEKVGNNRAITNIRLNKLEASLHHQKIEDVLPKIEALLKETIADKDTFSTNHLHLRLIYLNQKAGRHEDMERHVIAVEKIPLSSPMKSNEYAIAIYGSLGRADLFRVKAELDSAEKHYQKALKYSQDEPSRWIEIKILQNLTELEMERNQLVKAKSYLKSAQMKIPA